jgi:hypothetical protein
MRNLVVLLLIGVAAVGCASDESASEASVVAQGVTAKAVAPDLKNTRAVGAGVTASSDEASARATPRK